MLKLAAMQKLIEFSVIYLCADRTQVPSSDQPGQPWWQPNPAGSNNNCNNGKICAKFNANRIKQNVEKKNNKISKLFVTIS